MFSYENQTKTNFENQENEFTILYELENSFVLFSLLSNEIENTGFGRL